MCNWKGIQILTIYLISKGLLFFDTPCRELAWLRQFLLPGVFITLFAIIIACWSKVVILSSIKQKRLKYSRRASLFKILARKIQTICLGVVRCVCEPVSVKYLSFILMDKWAIVIRMIKLLSFALTDQPRRSLYLLISVLLHTNTSSSVFIQKISPTTCAFVRTLEVGAAIISFSTTWGW